MAYVRWRQRRFSRLLRQTKSALKAPSVIVTGHATFIEILTIATLMIKADSYYCPRLSYQRRRCHWLPLEMGWFKVKQQAFRLDMIIGRPAVLAGRYLRSKAKVLSCPSKRVFYLIKPNKDHLYLLSSCCVDYQYKLHGAI